MQIKVSVSKGSEFCQKYEQSGEYEKTYFLLEPAVEFKFYMGCIGSELQGSKVKDLIQWGKLNRSKSWGISREAVG